MLQGTLVRGVWLDYDLTRRLHAAQNETFCARKSGGWGRAWPDSGWRLQAVASGTRQRVGRFPTQAPRPTRTARRDAEGTPHNWPTGGFRQFVESQKRRAPGKTRNCHPQKRRVLSKVRNSRPKTRDSAARPWPVSRRSHRHCRGTQKRPAPAKTRNGHPPKNTAFLRRCATRARRCATRRQAVAALPTEPPPVPRKGKNRARQRRRATAAAQKTPRFCEDAQLAREDAQLATCHGPLTTDQISKDPCVRLLSPDICRTTSFYRATGSGCSRAKPPHRVACVPNRACRRPPTATASAGCHNAELPAPTKTSLRRSQRSLVMQWPFSPSIGNDL